MLAVATGWRVVAIYLALRSPAGGRRCGSAQRQSCAGRRCRQGRAANPGTGRTPLVPLFGLAPGGVWPSLRRRRRPDALTVRFQPCRRFPPANSEEAVGDLPAAVCFCATFRPLGNVKSLRSLGVTQHPVRWSPDFPPPRENPRRRLPGFRRPLPGTLAQGSWGVKEGGFRGIPGMCW